MVQVDLSGADPQVPISGANLQGANISNVTITGTNFTNVDFREAIFYNVDLTLANTDGAIFTFDINSKDYAGALFTYGSPKCRSHGYKNSPLVQGPPQNMLPAGYSVISDWIIGPE